MLSFGDQVGELASPMTDINQLPDITTLYGSVSPEGLASTMETTVDYVIHEFMPIESNP